MTPGAQMTGCGAALRKSRFCAKLESASIKGGDASADQGNKGT